MILTEKILTLLLNQQDQPLSGQAIASQLNITRNTVWQHIKALKNRGYIIKSQPGQGYLMMKRSPLLDKAQLAFLLKETFDSLYIEYHPSTTSTNDLAKVFQADHPHQPALFMTSHQSQGRGRYGKTFQSDLKQGLYLSLVTLPFTSRLKDLTLYTLMAAVAVVESLKPWVKDDLYIKWVNDIFYKNKKVAGILCESVMNLENYEPQAVIIGIGINLAGSFDRTSDLSQIAGTVFGESLPDQFNLNEFVASIIQTIEKFHLHPDQSHLIEQYDYYLLGKGQKVTYRKNNQTFTGILHGINKEGHLLINQNSHLETLIGSEVSFTSKQFIKEN